MILRFEPPLNPPKDEEPRCCVCGAEADWRTPKEDYYCSTCVPYAARDEIQAMDDEDICYAAKFWRLT